MTDDRDPDAAEHDPYIPDPGDSVSPDVAAAVGAEDFDEDRMARDPAEGVEAPDDWSAGVGYGTTQREQREGEALDDRLAQEEPDVD